MIPKDKLVFLNDTKNMFDFSQGTIDAYKLDDDDIDKIVQTLTLYSAKSKDHFANPAIQRQVANKFKNVDFVRIPKYPLPAVFNKRTKKIIINMNVWGRKDILNIPPQDLYAVLVYGYVCAYYTVKNIQEKDISIISDFMSSMFVRMFAKKYGLMGSYAGELPKLRFLVSTYVMVSFMGMSTQRAYVKSSHLAKTTKKAFDVDLNEYDFYSGKDFIRCLSDSGVLHGITTYEFASRMIRSFGAFSLPMFEDGMRFMATIAGSSILGTTMFPISLQRYSPKLYDKTITIISKAIK
jgi:hypothetical protein